MKIKHVIYNFKYKPNYYIIKYKIKYYIDQDNFHNSSSIIQSLHNLYSTKLFKVSISHVIGLL